MLKPKRRVTKPQSPLQKVCMQFGMDYRKLSNSYLLVQFLRQHGRTVAAKEVEAAIAIAKRVAKQNYFSARKALQPDWKDWDEESAELQAKQMLGDWPT